MLKLCTDIPLVENKVSFNVHFAVEIRLYRMFTLPPLVEIGQHLARGVTCYLVSDMKTVSVMGAFSYSCGSN